ncbi:MAG TPA: OsmC family protein [Usitatibacter sp.]|jgi:putative redox protein|nr:OsmC family protein [Usitatibacter sp.]
MKARIKLVDGITFVAESGSGHAIVVDAAPDVGGRNLGPRPMELVLMGAGACSAVDVMLILRKARQEVTDCVIEMDSVRADTDPKVFTRIHLHYVVTGKQLGHAQVERAIKLSKEKYCSATIMLAATCEITFDFEVREA